jgi:hypothetical protein
VTDPIVPNPQTAGQERNVFGRVTGNEFAYSESNDRPITAVFSLKPVAAGQPLQLLMFNRNPGRSGSTCDDNPAMNRGFTVDIHEPEAEVRFMDEPHANQYVTAIVDLGKHVCRRTYTFTFRYWPGTPPA